MISTTSSTEEKNNLSAAAEKFCRRFSLAEIQLATGDFSDAHVIGKGGFGKVYKGFIDNEQLIVAIKRLESNSNQGAREFLMEIETLSKLRHVNLVSLIGYCSENGEMILVYQYIACGTLADHLYKLSRNDDSNDCSSLTWKERLKICIGAARGIDYLHTGSSIIHRDVKSTNILLDEDLTAKVSDFGLAKHLSSGNSQSHVSTEVKGSFGYLDPSYFITGRLTRKSDTYSFGVVLLEVLCGRPAVDSRLGEDKMSLIMWAREKISKGKADQIVASNLRDEISADCLKIFVGVAKKCLYLDPEKRPTMAQVVVQLEDAFEQQKRKEATHNPSRFLSLNAFWNRAKSSGNRATASTENDPKQVDINMLPVAVPAIPLYELEDITNNFSSECVIGNGSTGTVFRGVLKNGQVAAIKMLDYSSRPDIDLLAQVSIISSLNHENITHLLGYCADGDRRFLAYEFAPNGSLDDLLYGQGSEQGLVLSWVQRVKIAFGAAKGLEYIHKERQIHSSIKPSNVLVFDDEVAKIADFGQSTHFPLGDPPFRDEPHPYALIQHCGYHPPEYGWYRELSCSGDVYSFGVVLLQLLTGCKLIDVQRPRKKQHLVQWAIPYFREDRVKYIVDSRLEGDYPPKAAARMAAIASLCLQSDAEFRPNMSTVVKVLRPLLKASSVRKTPNL